MDASYRLYNNPKMKEGYTKLISDNLETLIDYLYANTGMEQELRCAMAYHMILMSGNLVSIKNSILISKDIDSLIKNQSYLSKWEKPNLKRKVLRKELESLRKHTEIDDSISLNNNINDVQSILENPNETIYDIKSEKVSLDMNDDNTGCVLM